MLNTGGIIPGALRGTKPIKGSDEEFVSQIKALSSAQLRTLLSGANAEKNKQIIDAALVRIATKRRNRNS